MNYAPQFQPPYELPKRSRVPVILWWFLGIIGVICVALFTITAVMFLKSESSKPKPFVPIVEADACERLEGKLPKFGAAFERTKERETLHYEERTGSGGNEVVWGVWQTTRGVTDEGEVVHWGEGTHQQMYLFDDGYAPWVEEYLLEELIEPDLSLRFWRYRSYSYPKGDRDLGFPSEYYYEVGPERYWIYMEIEGEQSYFSLSHEGYAQSVPEQVTKLLKLLRSNPGSQPRLRSNALYLFETECTPEEVRLVGTTEVQLHGKAHEAGVLRWSHLGEDYSVEHFDEDGRLFFRRYLETDDVTILVDEPGTLSGFLIEQEVD